MSAFVYYPFIDFVRKPKRIGFLLRYWSGKIFLPVAFLASWIDFVPKLIILNILESKQESTR